MARASGDEKDLRRLLEDVDGAGYGAYKRLGDTEWDFEDFTLVVERVQADPFAPPSRVKLDVPTDVANLPDELWSTPARRRALEDHLARLFAAELDGGRKGSDFSVDVRGQEVLERTTCDVDADGVLVRIGLDLPARGRKIKGHAAAKLACDVLPPAVAACLVWDAIDQDEAWRVVRSVEDATTLRDRLPELGLVGFVADGAILPRRSGVDDRPLDQPGVVEFSSPESLRVSVDLPHRGRVTGMGVPEGVTLVVGGGFHGKSTLLRALERGVYDHLPGDGRELVVARPDAVKIRAEDGRRVERVDVSAFVGELPTGTDTADFSSENASGSTSQAANIAEALEAGAGTLLVDEDTSATNLMIRDLRMQELVSSDREPLTPFVDLVAPLYADHGVSTVVVVGGSGDYFDVADRVVAMDAFRPREVTEAARDIAARWSGRQREATGFPATRHRVVDPASVDPRRGGKIKTKGQGTGAVQFGTDTIDLSAVEQLVDPSQTTGIAQALIRLVQEGWFDGERSLAEALDLLDRRLAEEGMDVLRANFPGDLARPRRFEIAAAVNRLRSVSVTRFAA